ncbi:ABC transporter permease [Povalibacter sp.]|uniref:ABC transporter permease n=1 Tax=Povalibacter sp. TaxID=1962978 RepID=UPI002F4231B0
MREECGYIARSRWDRFLLFVLPMILLTVVGAMLARGLMREIPVAVVDLDRSSVSRLAIRKMQAAPEIRIVAQPMSLDDAWPLVRSGSVYSLAFLPNGMQAGALRKPEAAIVYYNGAFLTAGALAAAAQASAITASIEAAAQTRLRSMGLPGIHVSPPAVQVSVVGNPQKSFELFLGGLIAPGVLHLLMACAMVMGFGRELRGGSLSDWAERVEGRLLPAMLGKALPYVGVFSAWGVAWTAWLCGWCGWGIAGSPLVLLAGILALMVITAAISMLLIAVTGELDMSFSATAIYAGAAIAYSNGTLPLTHGPMFAQVWSSVLPYTHYLRIQNASMVMGADASASFADLSILLGGAAGCFWLALILTGRRSQCAPREEMLEFPLPAASITGAVVATFSGVFRVRPVASVLVLAVVAYAFYYPLAYAGQKAVKLPFAVIDLDRSQLSRDVVRHLDAAPSIDARVVNVDTKQAQRMLRNGEIDGVLLIPERFQQSLSSGAPRGIFVELDGAHLVRASALGNAFTQVVSAVGAESLAPLDAAVRLEERLPRVVQRPLYNTSEGYGSYAVPAVSAIILQQTLLLGSALIAAIRRQSHAARLRTRGFLGLWAALTALGTLSTLFYSGFVFWYQDYPRMGNPGGVFLFAPLFAAAVSALGLMLGHLFDRHERVMQIIVGTSVPLFFLGGAAWPTFMMPGMLAALAKLSPSTAAIQASVLLNSAGASMAEVRPHLLVLALLAACYGAWAWKQQTAEGDRSVNPRTA